MAFIFVSDHVMHLDADALKAGHIRVAQGSLSFECEGCGEDLTENASLTAKFIECECGDTYRIQDG